MGCLDFLRNHKGIFPSRTEEKEERKLRKPPPAGAPVFGSPWQRGVGGVNEWNTICTCRNAMKTKEVNPVAENRFSLFLTFRDGPAALCIFVYKYSKNPLTPPTPLCQVGLKTRLGRVGIDIAKWGLRQGSAGWGSILPSGA